MLICNDQRAAAQSGLFPMHFARFEIHAGQADNSAKIRVSVEAVQTPFVENTVVEVIPHVSVSVLLVQSFVGQSEHYAADVVPARNEYPILHDDGRR